MKTKSHFKAACLGLMTLAASALTSHAIGFAEPDILFYGEVRQVGGANTILLQSGELEMILVNQQDANNSVTLNASLRPTGTGELKLYSYAMRVPLNYLPHAEEKDSSLAIGSGDTQFHIQSILIDGRPATLPDASKEFFTLSFANKGAQYRLDLLVQGDSTDSDHDGLPDWWEDLHDLNPQFNDAGLDPDGDGWSNLEEFLLGSDPNVSNRETQLATRELRIPESGEAGLLLQFLDSDTPADQLSLSLTIPANSGFELKRDGVAVPADEAQQLLLADLQAGRVTVTHVDTAIRSVSLPVSWPGSSNELSGTVLLEVVLPSTEDSTDAGLWLDADRFGTPGERVSSWSDRSGNDLSAMQPLSDHQPEITTEASRMAVDFSTPDSHLFFQDAAMPAANQTLFAVFRSDVSSDEAQTVLSGNRGFLQLTPSTKAISYPGAPVYQIDGLKVQGYSSVIGSTELSIFRRDGSMLQHISGLCFDGEEAAGDSLDPVLPTLGARRMALPGDNPIRESFQGRLHEMLIFPRALQEQKLRDVHDYLKSKWSGAVVWDLSTDLRSHVLAGSGEASQIIRGGWGHDELGGGPAADILSGGPGDDSLSGGGGPDTFVFGGVDTGDDLITDYDINADIVDLSALFWGMTGDARDYLSVRLETDFSTPVPTLNSVLVVLRPDESIQEITLRNVALGAPQLAQLIVEGRIQMGSLTIPTEVELTKVSGDAELSSLGDTIDDSITLKVTRRGDGVAGEMEIPLGLFEQAVGRSLILEEADTQKGQRAVVILAPGQTEKTLTFRPAPGLDSEGDKAWEVALLPHYRFDVTGLGIQGVIKDRPRVWLEVLEPNVLAGMNQSAQVRIHRSGSLSGETSVDLRLSGNAVEGVHIAPVARNIVIPDAAGYADLSIAPESGWDAEQARTLILSLASDKTYQLGHPHQAILYAADTDAAANAFGFDQWIANVTGGAITSYRDLLDQYGPSVLADYIKAYALGSNDPADADQLALSIRLVNGEVEVSSPVSANAADVRWALKETDDARTWPNSASVGKKEVTSSGLKFSKEPSEDQGVAIYRVEYTLDQPSTVGGSVSALVGEGARSGMEGDVAWTSEGTGDVLISGPNAPGEKNRLIIEADAGTSLHFEMEIVDGNGSVVFYIDGAPVARTEGPAVEVNQTLTGSGMRLLMWESDITAGTAVIRPLN